MDNVRPLRPGIRLDQALVGPAGQPASPLQESAAAVIEDYRGAVSFWKWTAGLLAVVAVGQHLYHVKGVGKAGARRLAPGTKLRRGAGVMDGGLFASAIR